MGIQWYIYIYINIYPYKLWSILDVTCDQQEASAAVTWKNMEPLKRVFALGRFGSKIWDYPGPKALPKKKKHPLGVLNHHQSEKKVALKLWKLPAPNRTASQHVRNKSMPWGCPVFELHPLTDAWLITYYFSRCCVLFSENNYSILNFDFNP